MLMWIPQGDAESRAVHDGGAADAVCAGKMIGGAMTTKRLLLV